jgi:hypothetical protein
MRRQAGRGVRRSCLACPSLARCDCGGRPALLLPPVAFSRRGSQARQPDRHAIRRRRRDAASLPEGEEMAGMGRPERRRRSDRRGANGVGDRRAQAGVGEPDPPSLAGALQHDLLAVVQGIPAIRAAQEGGAEGQSTCRPSSTRRCSADSSRSCSNTCPGSRLSLITSAGRLREAARGGLATGLTDPRARARRQSGRGRHPEADSPQSAL